MKKLKIAQISPLIERVPPKKYGGTERVVWALTEELIKRGHDVTLFATGDSITSAKLVSVVPRSLRESKVSDLYGLNDFRLANLATAYSQQDKFDIMHDHNGHFGLLPAHFSHKPAVITLHTAFTITKRKIFEMMTNPYYVAISNSQAKNSPVKITKMIYNGLPMDEYPFVGKKGNYLLFVGRISMEKGVHYAIDVANALNIPLIIAAKLDMKDEPYYRTYIEPRLYNGQIKWIGEVDEKERNELMSNALCLLHPETWREPFGLTMIEALACGTPVIAFNKGSIPEIVKHGETGYVVNDPEEMIDSVLKIDEIDRKKCRQYAIENFNAKKMAEEYEKLYYEILETRDENRKDSIRNK